MHSNSFDALLAKLMAKSAAANGAMQAGRTCASKPCTHMFTVQQSTAQGRAAAMRTGTTTLGIHNPALLPVWHLPWTGTKLQKSSIGAQPKTCTTISQDSKAGHWQE